MKKMRVRQWLKAQNDRKISFGYEEINRIGLKNIKKVIKLSPKMNKTIATGTQDVENFITTDIANVPFVNKNI